MVPALPVVRCSPVHSCSSRHLINRRSYRHGCQHAHWVPACRTRQPTLQQHRRCQAAGRTHQKHNCCVLIARRPACAPPCLRRRSLSSMHAALLSFLATGEQPPGGFRGKAGQWSGPPVFDPAMAPPASSRQQHLLLVAQTETFTASVCMAAASMPIQSHLPAFHRLCIPEE